MLIEIEAIQGCQKRVPQMGPTLEKTLPPKLLRVKLTMIDQHEIITRSGIG